MSSEEKEGKRISRREFVKGAAVGAAGVAAAGALASCTTATPEVITKEVVVEKEVAVTIEVEKEVIVEKEVVKTVEVVKEVEVIKEVEVKPWLPEKWDYEADVVVVGFGGAGAAAAIEAADAGADVLVLDKASEPGGSTRVCGGIVYGAGTSVQEAAGITDSPDEMYKHWIATGEGLNDPDLSRVMADRSAGTIEWLIELGAEFPPEKLYISGPEAELPFAAITPPKRRGHPAVGRGAGLYEVLSDAVSERGAKVLVETRAVELVTNTEREVLGVKAERNGKTLLISAKKAVVLASGHFDHNEEMLKSSLHLTTDIYEELSPSYVPPGAGDGDGQIMANAIGASLRNMHLICFRSNTPIAHPRSPAAHCSILVNKRGRRFVNEDTHMRADKRKYEQEDRVVFQILDSSKPIDDNVKEKLIEAATIGELATKIGIDPEALEDTIDKWNRSAELGEDPEFGRTVVVTPIGTPPFYAWKFTYRIWLSLGGVRINTSAQAIDVFGEVIPRLYAAGAVTGGVIGYWYPGSGSLVGSSLTFGRVAGQNAAAEEPWS